jgi:2-keto-4-pentenoate hydratase/2-oxohepta-3-ene-1,7-dioic acid hydratase in catechol pathway
VLDLHPGDLISTGTPPGTGNGRTPPRYLGPGDVVRMQLGDLVELVNPVVDEAVA